MITLRIYEKKLHFSEIAAGLHKCGGGLVCILDPLPLGIFLLMAEYHIIYLSCPMQVFLLPRIGHSTLVTAHMDMVPAVLCKLSAAVNPLIYGLL